MTQQTATRNWLVRAYQGEQVVARWTIDNRTEHEAENEAAADVARICCDDWTLTEELQP